MVKKKFEDIFIRVDVIHERDGRTDGQTDGQTLRDSKDRAYASPRAVKIVILNEYLGYHC